MKQSTESRKNTIRGFKGMYGQEVLVNRMYQIIAKGKRELDTVMMDIGRLMAETIGTPYQDNGAFEEGLVFDQSDREYVLDGEAW